MQVLAVHAVRATPAVRAGRATLAAHAVRATLAVRAVRAVIGRCRSYLFISHLKNLIFGKHSYIPK